MHDYGFMNVTQYQKKRKRKELKSNGIFLNNKEKLLAELDDVIQLTSVILLMSCELDARSLPS